MTEYEGGARPAGPRRQLSDEVANHVREMIISGHLPPGEFIRQDRIAEELDLSATPVREGLLSLCGEGIIELIPRRGFVVAPLSAADVSDLFTAQALLAGELAARATDLMDAPTLRRLQLIHRDLRRAASAADGDLVVKLNYEFHRAINLTADSYRLAWMLSIATKFAPRQFYATVPAWWKASARDHNAIMAAISKGDPDAARQTMIAHMENAGKLLASNFDAAQLSSAEQG